VQKRRVQKRLTRGRGGIEGGLSVGVECLVFTVSVECLVFEGRVFSV
jgi:hypothetical protein